MNSNLATILRTIVVLIMAWGMVFITKSQGGIDAISTRSWVFLILSGLATGASWLCYFKALQMGDASKVVPVDKMSIVITIILAVIFLHETITVKSAIMERCRIGLLCRHYAGGVHNRTHRPGS